MAVTFRTLLHPKKKKRRTSVKILKGTDVVGAVRYKRTTNRINLDIARGSKRCTVCIEDKVFEDFYIYNKIKDSRNPTCITCLKLRRNSTDVSIRDRHTVNLDIARGRKNCTICKEDKVFDDFYMHNKIRDRRNPICITCCKLRRNSTDVIVRGRRAVNNDIKNGSKVCRCCKARKLFDKFHKNRNRRDGRIHICKDCNRLQENKTSVRQRTAAEIARDIARGYKICTKCKVDKPFKEFSDDSKTLDKYKHQCRECANRSRRENWRRVKNQFGRVTRVAAEIAKDIARGAKCCNSCNVDKPFKEFHRDRKSPDDRLGMCKSCSKITFRSFGSALNGSLKMYVKGYKPGKRAHWEISLNYTCKDLKEWLEAQWEPGMTWENKGKHGWHTDHIIPISSFTFKDENDPEFHKCWALSNLRPLWATTKIAKAHGSNQIGNLNKGNKILEA